MKIKTWTSPDLVVHNINDGTNYDSILLRDAYGLPKVEPIMGERQGYWPIFSALKRSGKQLYIHTIIKGVTPDTLQTQLAQWFDPDSEEEGVLTVEDDAGGNDRYVEAVCESLSMINNDSGLEWLITLRISEDIYWREPIASTDSASITASGQTKSISNSGDMDAFPIFTLTPTSQKTASPDGYTLKRFFTVLWNLDVSAVAYPTDIANNAFDTATIITAGDMQGDGDDLRVFVDGVEVDRWLDDIDTNNTSVWVNLNWSAAISLTVDGALGVGPTEITFNESITNLPSAGIIYIDTELITYASKNNQTKTIENCLRGAKSSTETTHLDGATADWIQHDIWVLYGNGSSTAPVTDDDFKPIFELASSTNVLWDFDKFLDDNGFRTGGWYFSLTSSVTKYGGDHWTTADPWVELGLHHDGKRPVAGSWGRALIYNPAGITNANCTNGEKKCNDKSVWTLGSSQVQSSSDGEVWVDEYDIPVPTANDAWEAWSQNIALTSGAKYVAVNVNNHRDGIWLEVSDIALTITNPFTITIGGEVINYHIACTITNETTDDAVSLIFPCLLNDDLEINTDEKTLTYVPETSNQFSALTLIGGPRRDWLPLAPGTNVIRYDETGVVAVTFDFEWEERFYQ
jgi:hypothetical protein